MAFRARAFNDGEDGELTMPDSADRVSSETLDRHDIMSPDTGACL